MTSRQDISRTNSVQQKAYNLIKTTHNGQKEWRLIRISHHKPMQPNATNFTTTSHNGKKPRHLVRKSPRDKIRQQKTFDLIKKSHKGHKKTSTLLRKSHYGQEAWRPFSAYSITLPSPELTLMHAFTSPPRHQPEPLTQQQKSRSQQHVATYSHSMVVTLETRILEHNMQQKAGISAGNLILAKKNI